MLQSHGNTVILWKPKVSTNGRIEYTIVEDKKVEEQGVKNRLKNHWN